VCPTCGLEAPEQTASNPEALYSSCFRGEQTVTNVRAALTRVKKVRSFVSRLKSKLFRPRRNFAYVPEWWCYQCGVTLTSFVCPTCGLRGPDYGEPTWPVDDLERAHLAQTSVVDTFSNVRAALTHAKNVGYLTRGDNYPRGEVSEEAVECLVRLVRRPLVEWLGYHYCELDPCWLKQPRPELRYKGIRIPSRCSTDILVPNKATAYVAPALILHYILFHQYLPPTCFLEAVLACPDPSSSEYLDAIGRIYPATLQAENVDEKS
jgi:hypothetical protein